MYMYMYMYSVCTSWFQKSIGNVPSIYALLCFNNCIKLQMVHPQFKNIYGCNSLHRSSILLSIYQQTDSDAKKRFLFIPFYNSA